MEGRGKGKGKKTNVSPSLSITRRKRGEIEGIGRMGKGERLSHFTILSKKTGAGKGRGLRKGKRTKKKRGGKSTMSLFSSVWREKSYKKV